MYGALRRCENGHYYSARVFGKECPFCKKDAEAEATEEKSEELQKLLLKEDISPVCGWLVCISGAQQGRDYRIKEGKNFAGRADDMDIQILGDDKIARRNHAIIVYDPKQKSTVLLPGDSNGLVYHNNMVVFAPTPLSAYDAIEIGGCLFVFVPFCGDNFVWTGDEEENQKKEQGYKLKQAGSDRKKSNGSGVEIEG